MMKLKDKPMRRVEIATTPGEMVLVSFTGQEWAKIGDVARLYGVESRKIAELCDVIAESHQMRVLEMGARCVVINLADFRRGLMDVVAMRQGYTRRGM